MCEKCWTPERGNLSANEVAKYLGMDHYELWKKAEELGLERAYQGRCAYYTQVSFEKYVNLPEEELYKVLKTFPGADLAYLLRKHENGKTVPT